MQGDSPHDKIEVQNSLSTTSSCQQFHGQLAMQSGNVQSAFADERVKWVYGNIYECLQHDVRCSRRILFGSNYYCGWLLNDDLVRFDHELPCSDRG
ncbi:MAG: hypothetical protein HGB32_14365 [Geobacteraceae bacterium]|nr:hypothetical protein [Geobacteraceae bacterium]NTW81310.1 hypothetical protein [Geobacteraceae bacterium]